MALFRIWLPDDKNSLPALYVYDILHIHNRRFFSFLWERTNVASLFYIKLSDGQSNSEKSHFDVCVFREKRLTWFFKIFLSRCMYLFYIELCSDVTIMIRYNKSIYGLPSSQSDVSFKYMYKERLRTKFHRRHFILSGLITGRYVETTVKVLYIIYG